MLFVGRGGRRCVVGDEFAIWHKLHESDIIFTYISYKIIIGSIFIGIFMNIEDFQRKYRQYLPINHEYFLFL